MKVVKKPYMNANMKLPPSGVACHFAHAIERFLSKKENKKIRSTSMNCSRASCAWQQGFSRLPIVNYVFTAYTAENCEFVNYIGFYSASPCSHVSLLDDCFRLYWRRDAENERFRFNVSCLFPRRPLKVWRTMLDAVRFNSIFIIDKGNGIVARLTQLTVYVRVVGDDNSDDDCDAHAVTQTSPSWSPSFLVMLFLFEAIMENIYHKQDNSIWPNVRKHIVNGWESKRTYGWLNEKENQRTVNGDASQFGSPDTKCVAGCVRVWRRNNIRVDWVDHWIWTTEKV